jgi:hypothetical protein
MQRRLFLTTILAAISTDGGAHAQMRTASAFAVPRDYAIDGYFGRETVPARLYRTRDAIRYEARSGSVAHTVVARLDRDVAWFTLPSLGLAFQTDISGIGLSPRALAGEGFRESFVARETHSGMAMSKLRLTRTAVDPAFDGFAWIGNEGILWRLQGAGEAQGTPGTFDWRFENATLGTLDPALFEAPPGRVVPVAGDALAAMLRRFGLVR